MTKRQAEREAQQRWGQNAVARFTCGAFRKADREKASADLKEHRANKPVRPFPNTVEYTRLFRAWRAEEERLMDIVMHEPCDVGELTPLGALGMVFHVWGSGDTWEEAFAAADTRRPAKALQ